MSFEALLSDGGTVVWELRGFVNKTQDGFLLNHAAEDGPYRLTNFVRLKGKDLVDVELVFFKGVQSDGKIVVNGNSFMRKKQNLQGSNGDWRAIFDARRINTDDRLTFTGILRACTSQQRCTDLAVEGEFNLTVGVKYSSRKFPNLLG